MIDDLAAFGLPVLLFSGGEPFLRRDLYERGGDGLHAIPDVAALVYVAI